MPFLWNLLPSNELCFFGTSYSGRPGRPQWSSIVPTEYPGALILPHTSSMGDHLGAIWHVEYGLVNSDNEDISGYINNLALATIIYCLPSVASMSMSVLPLSFVVIIARYKIRFLSLRNRSFA